MLGLYDTQDRLWVGNEEGPLLYEDAALARLAAMVVDRSLKQSTGRTRALPFIPRLAILCDEKPVLIDPVKVLEQLGEGG